MTPREQKLMTSNYTPAVIDKMRKDWSSKEMASALDMRVREIEKIGDLTFLEMGLCVMEFERNSKLWDALGYASFPSWMNSGRVKGSRSKRYAALAAVKAMLEINVPLEEAEKLPRGSLQALSSVPKQHREKFVKAAPDLEVNHLREKISRECPDAHIEKLAPMRFQPSASQRKAIDAGIDAAMLLEELSTREEVLEMWAADYLEKNRRKLEKVLVAHV